MARITYGFGAGACVLLLVVAIVAEAQPPPRPPLDPSLVHLTSAGPNRADEPFAKNLSFQKTREFLDEMAVNWVRTRKCGTCHTATAFMLGRAILGPNTTASDEVRKHFESRASTWDSMADIPTRGDVETSKGWGYMSWWPGEVVVTSAALAMNDAGTTGHLHPTTRKALDRLWTVQRGDGGWNWVPGTPPLEGSDYYGASFAAVAVGVAPDGYADTPAARAGLEKLRGYLKENRSAAILHDRAMTLWASTKLPGILNTEERQSTVNELLALQHADGGWSLPSLGNWKRADGSMNDREGAPSDGYGTGFVVYVLRQAGIPTSDPALVKAVSWLKTNQRESGRWFTRSLVRDSYHFISHAGTVYAAMALEACGVTATTHD